MLPASKCDRLRLASHDLRLAIVCIRELAKQRKVGHEVWVAASEWQAAAHQRWMRELDLLQPPLGRLLSERPTLEKRQWIKAPSPSELVKWINDGYDTQANGVNALVGDRDDQPSGDYAEKITLHIKGNSDEHQRGDVPVVGTVDVGRWSCSLRDVQEFTAGDKSGRGISSPGDVPGTE
jgi:hypothetical protein